MIISAFLLCDLLYSIFVELKYLISVTLKCLKRLQGVLRSSAFQEDYHPFSKDV